MLKRKRILIESLKELVQKQFQLFICEIYVRFDPKDIPHDLKMKLELQGNIIIKDY